MNDIKDYPRLEQWLSKHNAQFCYSLLPRSHVQQGITPSIQAFKVNGRIAHVVLYPGTKGWDVITGLDVNDIEQTLADAEKRLGCDLVVGGPGHGTGVVTSSDPLSGLEEFARRGMAAQSAIDAVVHRDGPEQFGTTPPPGDDLVAAVRAYLSFAEINRADETDLDERVKAREEMTRYENQLRQLVGWEPSRAGTARREILATNLKLSKKDVQILKREAAKGTKGKKAKR